MVRSRERRTPFQFLGSQARSVRLSDNLWFLLRPGATLGPLIFLYCFQCILGRLEPSFRSQPAASCMSFGTPSPVEYISTTLY